ncbi:MAG: DNA primase [Phycisphaerae bacterium]
MRDQSSTDECAFLLRDFEAKKRAILDRVDILDVVSEHVALKRSGQRWVGLCPFHAEKTPSFTIRPDHGTFKCFGCGKGGDVFSFVQLRENIPFVEAMHILADRAGVELGGGRDETSTGPDRADLARVNAWALRFFRSQLLDKTTGGSAREYVRRRAVSDATAERFSLGLATGGTNGLREAAGRAGFDTSLLLAADLIRQNEQGRFYDTFRNRLMFPIRDATNRVVGFGGRTLGDDRAKYLNTRQNALFEKGKVLYGIELARKAAVERRRAIIVEGYLDCLAAHQAGFTETVATLGTALTESQVELLRRYCEQIILLFDSDEAGEAAAERAIQVAVPRNVSVGLAHIPDGKDPSDFLSSASAGEFSDLLNRAVDALEFKWHRTRERFEGDASDAKRREAVLEFLRVVADTVDTKAVDVIQRGSLVNQVAHLLQMNRGEVDRLLARLQARRTGRVASPAERADEPTRTAPLDAERIAWTRVLEVLLNEPGALAVIKERPDVTAIADDRDRRIATIVFELAGEIGEFRLADVLARCDDPADAERVTELAHRGAGLGNYEAMLRAAFDRIRRASEDRELERSKERLLHVETQPQPLAGPTADRKTVCDGMKKHAHFAPRRLIRQGGEALP